MTSWTPPPVSTPKNPMAAGWQAPSMSRAPGGGSLSVFNTSPPRAPYYLGGPRTSGAPLPAGSPLARMPDSAGVSPNWAVAAAVAGQLTQAYASFNATRLAAYEGRAQASAFAFRARMLELDRRAAEIQAQSILDQGQSEAGMVGLEGAQRRAEMTASAAANGRTAGVGSAADVQVSERLMEAIDVYHVNLASVRQANAARTAAVGIGNQAAFARTSSRMLRRSARASAPETQLVGGLASGALAGYEVANYRRA